jgi:type IV pilus assembly protein PilM
MLFRRNKQPKRDVALGVDLGTSQIKAAVVRRRGDKIELTDYAIRPLTPSSGKAYKDPQFAVELQQLIDGLDTTERRAFVTLSCTSAMVCQTEFPPMPLPEIKSALKLNSARYLRRDFSSYYLDAIEINQPQTPGKKDPRTKVLVGGANKEEVDACREALLAAKVKTEAIELAAVSVINAFHVSYPDLKDEVVLVVDIGARSTSINFLSNGQPLITRIMHFGGGQISEYISQILMLDAQEAEEEKLKMSDPVQELVKSAISPLAREVRSSIDFFERQHDHRVHRIFACGGSATSPHVLQFLGDAVGLPVECWNPVQSLDVSGFNGETPQVMALGPSLAAAVGAAAARLS